MKLAVSTICPQIRHGDRWWSYEPFVLEMNRWAAMFEEVVLVAPLSTGPPPPFSAPYASDNFRVQPYRRDRGVGLDQERTSPLELPAMILAVLRACASVDAFHVRCPGSIGLVSALLVPFLRRRRIAKFAGQWNGYPGEPLSVRLQRGILGSRIWRAPVTVYGEWPSQPAWVVPFFTSVVGEAQMARAAGAARRRTAADLNELLFVGRLTESKNVHVLLEALRELRERRPELRATIVGEGPWRGRLETLAAELGLEGRVRFVGGLEFERVLEHYERAGVLVLASETEGWPKAIAEGMAFGLVCVGSNRGLVPWMLGEGRGYVVEPGDKAALAACLDGVLGRPEEQIGVRDRAAPWAQRFTMEALQAELESLLERTWGRSISPRPGMGEA